MAPEQLRELDALIAEKVMGWRRFDMLEIESDSNDPLAFSKTNKHVVLMPPSFNIEDAKPPTGASLYEACSWKLPDVPIVPHYSTDIAAAWKVVDKMLNEGHDFTLDSGRNRDSGEIFHSCRINDVDLTYSNTAPLAICLAALKL